MIHIPKALLGLSLSYLVGACSSAPPPPTLAHAGCVSDSECAARGGVCVAGTCQQCRTSADCNGGSCVQNRCETAPTPVAETRPEVIVRSTDGGPACFERVHFAFDDSALSEAARASLQQTSDCLRRERGQRFVLIGHADPRGSVEYNLALGHRRAQAVLNYLVALGIERRRLAASSVGSEYATGTDEEGWARDRHVEYSERNASNAR